MLRALAVSALLIPAAVTDRDAGQDAPIVLQKGDVVCVGYERQSNSCLVKQLVGGQATENITMLEEMQLTNFGTPLKITTLSTSKRKGTRYCLAPDSIRAVVVPEIHHAAALLTTATIRGLNQYARASFCVEHRPCGDQHVAIAHAGKTRFAEEDMVYTLFRSGDPAIDTLGIRAMEIEQLDEIKGFAPVSCLPAE